MKPPAHEPIYTKRLVLRPLQPSDADAMFTFLSEVSVMNYTTRKPFTELHQASTYLAERIAGDYNFAVTLKPSEPLPQDRSGNSTSPPTLIGILGSFCFPEIGYLFSPKHGRKGYATEALLAFTPRLFAVMPSDQLFAEANVDPENQASMALLERCGWSRGEVERDAYVSPLLGTRDSVCYRIAREGYNLEDVMGGKEDGGGFVPDLQ